MRFGFVTVLAALFVLAFDLPCPAQESRGAPEASGVVIYFEVQPAVTLKLKSGRTARGKLISLSATEAIVDTGQRDRETGELGSRFAMTRVASLKTNDDRLTYDPDKDDFASIVATIQEKFPQARGASTLPGMQSLPGSGIPGAQPPAVVTPKLEKPVAVKPKSPKPVPNLGNGGFGGLENVPKKTADPDPAVAEDPAMAEPTAPLVTFTCSTCSQLISTADQSKGVCPHCGIAWTADSHSATPSGIPGSGIPGSHGAMANVSAGMQPPVGAFPGGPQLQGAQLQGAQFPGGAVKAGPAPAPLGPGQAAVPLGPGQGGVQAGQAGFTIESVPNWAKAVVFIALLLAAYHFLLNK